MPAVAKSMVFDYELRGDRGVVAEAKRRGGVELLVGEGADDGGGFPAVLAQKLQSFGFAGGRSLFRVARVHLRDGFPGHFGYGFAAADRFGDVHLDGIDAGDMVNNHSDGAAIVSAGRAW